MSGGHFNYYQYHINQIADDLDDVILKNGSPEKDSYGSLVNHNFTPEVIEQFKIAANIMRIAYVYAQRCDWLLSGDDGEDSFIRRLERDIKELKPYEI